MYTDSLHTLLNVRRHNSIRPAAPFTHPYVTEKTRQWQNPMELWNPLQRSVNYMYQILEHFSTVTNLNTASQQSCPLKQGNGSPLGRVCEQSGRRWNVRGAPCRVLSVPARIFSGFQAKHRSKWDDISRKSLSPGWECVCRVKKYTVDWKTDL